MTAPVTTPSTQVIQSQAATVASSSVTAQQAAAAYVALLGQDEESWYSTDAITSLAEGLARISDSFSVNAARVTDRFIADAVANLTGKRYREIGVRDTIGLTGERGIRVGVTTAGVFGRAADTYRYQQSLLDSQFIADVQGEAPEPTELVSPLDAAVNRVKRGTQYNLMLAARQQANATMADAWRRDLITGYRRVLHAELSDEGSCGLCVAASTRVYRADHLMPIHPGCHCLPVPVSRTKDPGAAINDEDLARFYDEAGGTTADKLRATRYKVDEHGEVGPVLRPHGDPIRTEEQARRDTNRPRRAKTDAEKARTLQARRNKLDRALRKAPATPTPAWKARMDAVGRRIDRLDRQIVSLGG